MAMALAPLRPTKWKSARAKLPSSRNVIRMNSRMRTGTRPAANCWAPWRTMPLRRRRKMRRWSRNGTWSLPRAVTAPIEWRTKRIWANSSCRMAWRRPRTIRWWKRAGKSWSRKAESLKAPDSLVAEVGRGHDVARPTSRTPETHKEQLIAKYRKVRNFSAHLCRNLEPEDYVVQSMPDVSPTKWHLAHTSWFFETFVVKVWMPSYRSEVPQYAYLFNSYYNAAGDMHRRDLRGLISRPTVAETYRFRESIDDCVLKLLGDADESFLAEIEPVLTLGLHHEQQHQELLVTDIKHVFSQNPLCPVFAETTAEAENGRVVPPHFVEFEEAIVSIGHDGAGFSYDNEGPRHRALVPAFSVANRLITNGEYLAFMEAGGYSRPEFWLSLGWTTVNEQRWQAPLYWVQRDGAWWNFTLSGFRPVNEAEPVTHISYFEADAYANWD